MRRARLFLVLILTTGCASEPPTMPGGPLNVQLVLAPGESAEIDGTALRLSFQGVMADSRCPSNAICVWQGDAIVRIDVVADRPPSTGYDLHTNNMQPIRHGDVTVALGELSPYPFSGRPIAARDYRATFRVTR